jgi:23S rRNA (cytidine2498-2'-O)-methyltransferase
MTDRPQFLFVTCQFGAEQAVKRELGRRWPEFRFAYSRPGFLTFKVPQQSQLYADFDLESVFARSSGLCLGKVSGEDPAVLAAKVWELFGQRPCRKIHVWARETAEPSQRKDFSPLDLMAQQAREHLAQCCPKPDLLTNDVINPQQPARRGEFVLDCIVVQPTEWWVGTHRVHSVPSQWPGGCTALEMPPEIVSRAWLKMEEALRWSQLPAAAGARWVELGSAPGGASQALLKRGFFVLGIDPAEMHSAVLEHPRFTHLRQRTSQVRRREFRKIRWLATDMNVAPNYALDAVEDIVTHREVNIRGMLLTLKLIEWELADHIAEYLDRVRSWGFNEVAARQLQHNRQEVCVAALQRPFRRKPLERHR